MSVFTLCLILAGVWLPQYADGHGFDTLTSEQGLSDIKDAVQLDFDSDGDLDIVVAESSATISLYENDGAGGLSLFGQVSVGATFGFPFLGKIVSANMNNDNLPDLVMTNTQSSGPKVVILYNLGSAPYFATYFYDVISDTGTALDVDAYDYNDDGLGDVIISKSGTTNNVAWFINTGSGYTKAGQLSSGTASPLAVRFYDFYDDGLAELVVGNTTNVRVYQNNGSLLGTFNTSGNGVQSLVIDDIDDDGAFDIAAVNMNTNSVSIFYGNVGTFTAATVVSNPGFQPNDTILADFDRDGLIDIGISNQGDSSVTLLYGTGNRFDPFQDLYTGSITDLGTTARTLLTGDFDGDTDTDIFVAFNDNAAGDDMFILENHSFDPTISAPTMTTSTDGSGLVTISTAFDDDDLDPVTLTTYYEADSCSVPFQFEDKITISSLVTSTYGYGDITLGAGQINTIATDNGQNTVSFIWDTKSDIPEANGTYCLYMTGFNFDNQGYTVGSDVVTSTIQLDNVAPASPTLSSVDASTSTIDIEWATVSGASSYTVSSTAAGAATVTSTSYSYTVLDPNTLYSFQLRSQDTFGNTSTYSTVTSTYTDPATPGTPTATLLGQTNISLSWSANGNPSGTVYEVYNVTNSSVVTSTTSTSAIATGLTASTFYEFKIRAQSFADESTYSAYSGTSTGITTSAPASSVTMTLSTSAPAPVSFQFAGSSESHTVTLSSVVGGVATLLLQSSPVTVSLSEGQSDNVDLSGDGNDDTTVTMNTVGASSAGFTLSAYTPESSGFVGEGGSSSSGGGNHSCFYSAFAPKWNKGAHNQ